MGSFSAILHQTATAGVSLTVAVCLVLQKISPFGVLRSFEGEIFLTEDSKDKKYFVHFKDDGFSVGEKILSKPCKSLWEPA